MEQGSGGLWAGCAKNESFLTGSIARPLEDTHGATGTGLPCLGYQKPPPSLSLSPLAVLSVTFFFPFLSSPIPVTRLGHMAHARGSATEKTTERSWEFSIPPARRVCCLPGPAPRLLYPNVREVRSRNKARRPSRE